MKNVHVPQSRWWDWAAIGLLFVLLQTLASRLVATNWTPFLYLIQTFTILGFIIGVSLGYSIFRPGTARLLNFFYLLILLPLRWTLVIDQHTSLEEQLASVGGRLFYSTSDFFARRPVEDPIFFIAIMSIAFWGISSWAGYTLVRKQEYLGAVLPAAIGLMIIHNYDRFVPGRLWFLAFFAFIALLLLGRMQFLQNKLAWRERRVFLSPDNSVDLTSSMAIAAGLIILIAWTTPATVSSLQSAADAWHRVTRPWREFTERMENAISALDAKSVGVRGDFFGTELQLGRGLPLSDQLVFEVEVPDVSFEQKPPRYYWRGRVYDHYLNGEWLTTGTERGEYSPDVINPYDVAIQEQTPARFVFNTGNSRFSLLYSPAQPIWISRPGVTFTTPSTQGKEIIAWHAYPSLRAGETYQVDAMLLNPNRQELQEAGTEYPDWVSERYLQLPENFSPRIQQLAQEVTAGAQTPYEKASAITRYLRENIEYSLTIDEAPRNRDRLEWVLFDYKRGYCVYYASAEVLMLRSVGVPARMAVGFSQGEEAEQEENTYVVRRLNAHAWPEIYFPGIGWVEFEPTAGEDPLNRPLPPQDGENANTPLPLGPLAEEGDFLGGHEPTDAELNPAGPQPFGRLRPSLFLIPLAVMLAAGLVFAGYRRGLHARVPVFLRTSMERSGLEVPRWILRWETWVNLTAVERSFESVNFGLRLLKSAMPLHATPVERAARLTELLPVTADQIQILLDEHQTSLYTSRVADVMQARRAAHNIRKQSILERIRYLFYRKSRR